MTAGPWRWAHTTASGWWWPVATGDGHRPSGVWHGTPGARTPGGTLAAVSVLVVTDERFLDHRPGDFHPERPARLEAVWSGLDAAGLGDAVVRRPAVAASDEDLLRCHPASHLSSLIELDEAGGGAVDRTGICEEEVQVLLGPEAGVEEGSLLVGGQRRGEDRVVAVGPDVVDDLGNRWRVEQPAAEGDDLGLWAVAATGAEAEADAGGGGEHPGSGGRPG